MAGMHRGARRTGARLARSVAMAGLCGVVGSDVAMADWNPLTGVKVGSDKAVETAPIYTGPQLAVFGGSLGFLGSAVINGPVLLVEQNGWGSPIVTVAESLTVNGTSFQALSGSSLTVNGADRGSVTVSGDVTVAGGSQVTIGDLTASGRGWVFNIDTMLHVMGDHIQTKGELVVESGASYRVDGTLSFVGSRLVVIGATEFLIGDPAAGSVMVFDVLVAGGSQVTIGDLTASGHDPVAVFNVDTLLHVMGDLAQSNPFLLVNYGASLHVAGTLQHSGKSPGTLIIGGGSDLRVGQTLDLSDDQLFVNGAATIGADVTLVENTLGIGAGGALRGTGTIVVDLVVNGGTVQPEANATALVVGGAYAQVGAGTLAIELPAPGSAGGSSGNEFMTVLGAATLDGRLELTFAEGFTAMPGDSWTIMTAGSIEGSFATVAPCGFTVAYRDNEVVATYAFDASPGDLTCDAMVDAADLAILLGAWGTCGECPADLDGDGTVGAVDLALLLGSWGG